MGSQEERVISKCKVCGNEIQTGGDTVAAFCDKCVKVQQVNNPLIGGGKGRGTDHGNANEAAETPE